MTNDIAASASVEFVSRHHRPQVPPGTSIHLKAILKRGDPVELAEAEVRR